MSNPAIRLEIKTGLEKLKESLGRAKSLINAFSNQANSKLSQLRAPRMGMQRLRDDLRDARRMISDHVGGMRRSLGGMEAPKLKTGGFLQSLSAMKLAVLGTVAAIGVSLGGAISSGLEGTQKKTSFQVLAGDAAGGKLYGDLTKFAQDSIFGTELYDNAQTMLAFGQNVNDIMPRLKMLGDISMGSKEKLQSLTLAFSQIQSAGRLTGQDLLQLINAGFNPLTIISEQTGKSMADLKKIMEGGGISADMVTEAFKSATSEGGKFFNMTERIAETPFGKWEALKGQLQGVGLQFGTALLPTVSKVLDILSPALDKLPAMLDTFVPLLDMIAEMAGPIIGDFLYLAQVILRELMPVVKSLTHLFLVRLGPAVKIAATIIEGLLAMLRPALEFVGKLADGISWVMDKLWGGITDRKTYTAYYNMGDGHGRAYAGSLNSSISKSVSDPTQNLKQNSAKEIAGGHGMAYANGLNGTIAKNVKDPTATLKDNAGDNAYKLGKEQGNEWLDGFRDRMETFDWNFTAKVNLDITPRQVETFKLDAPDKTKVEEPNAQAIKAYTPWFNKNFDKLMKGEGAEPMPKSTVKLAYGKDGIPKEEQPSAKIGLATSEQWEAWNNKKKGLNPEKVDGKGSGGATNGSGGVGVPENDKADRISGAAQQVRNVNVTFGSYIKGDVITQNKAVQSMSKEELMRFLDENMKRLLYTLETAY